jgi:hypothetical protein
VAAVCLLVFCGGPRFSLVKVEGGGSWAGEGPPSRWRSFFLLPPTSKNFACPGLYSEKACEPMVTRVRRVNLGSKKISKFLACRG